MAFQAQSLPSLGSELGKKVMGKWWVSDAAVGKISGRVETEGALGVGGRGERRAEGVTRIGTRIWEGE